MVRVDYTRRESKRGNVFWTPIVEAQFVVVRGNEEKAFRTNLALDTGADRTHFPVKLGEQIGIDISECGDPLTADWGDGWRGDVWELPGKWTAQIDGLAPAPIRPMLGNL